MNFRDVDNWRKFHLAIAEWVDAWRIIPRAIVVMFGYGAYHVTKWYMNLAPYVLEECVKAGGTAAECIVQAPTTQHTALVSALFALSAAIFAFYSNNGRKWDGFISWNKDITERSIPKLDETKHKGGNGG